MPQAPPSARPLPENKLPLGHAPSRDVLHPVLSYHYSPNSLSLQRSCAKFALHISGAVKELLQLLGRLNPSVSFAASIPQFSMVVPLRSQARLWHSLLHWAYFALLRAQRARFVRPLWNQGEPFGKWHNRRKQHYPKASLWHQREVARRSRDGGIRNAKTARVCHLKIQSCNFGSNINFVNALGLRKNNKSLFTAPTNRNLLCTFPKPLRIR